MKRKLVNDTYVHGQNRQIIRHCDSFSKAKTQILSSLHYLKETGDSKILP